MTALVPVDLDGIERRRLELVEELRRASKPDGSGIGSKSYKRITEQLGALAKQRRAVEAMPRATSASTEIELSVEAARDLLARALRVDEAKKIRDQADAMALYMRKRKASLEAQNDAAEIGILAMRRIGELTRAMARSAGPGRGRKVSADRTTFGKQLASQGLSRQEAALCQKLADAPERTIAAHIASVRERAARLTKSGTIAAVSHGDSYDSNEWYTPDRELALVRKVLGRIDCDPMSCAAAQKRVRAKVFYTKVYPKAQNGLAKPWVGRVFCNPPFEQPTCGEAIAKFIAEYKAGRMREGILLLNAITDTKAFHALARAGALFCFTEGRIAFIGPDGKPVEGNRAGQVFAYLGEPHRALFAEVFDAIGIVLGRVVGKAVRR